MSLINQYRQTQRQLRRLFEPFCQTHCPTCSEPCCRKPVRVTFLDIALAQSVGFCPPREANPEKERAQTILALINGEEPSFFQEEIPCDFLGKGGCTFPSDLRPFECTRYICRFMESDMDPTTLRRIKILLKRLTKQHQEIVTGLKKQK